MSDAFWDSFDEAWRLVRTLDPEVMEIAWRSLRVAATSSALSFILLALPLGALIHFNRFPGKNLLIMLIHTMFALPAVAVGLIAYHLLSQAGPMADLHWLFTTKGIIFAQMILITPVMLGLVISALSGVDKSIPETAIALGANRRQTYMISIREARYGILTALVMGFGRAISEVGVSLMVGFNIVGVTRTLTTAITLENGRGETELALALGMILILVAFAVNFIAYGFQYHKQLFPWHVRNFYFARR